METDCPLRILIVEDLPSDAELAERELRKGGVLFTSLRVDTQEAFLRALEEFQPDLIVSDYAMPEFDGMQALQLSLAHDPHIPFILLTGSVNEETAVACMKAGATDYIIKEHIARLPLAVSGALEQRRARLEEEKAAEELIAIYENAPLIMMLMDGDSRIRKINDYAAKFSDRSADAMLRMRCGEALRCLHALASPEGCGFGPQCKECTIRRIVKDALETGRSHHHVEGSLSYGSEGQEGKMTFLLSAAKLHFKRQPMVLVSLLDITESKQTEKALQRQNVYLESLNETALGLMSRMDLADLLRAIIVRGTRFVGAEEGWICIYESQDGDFEYKAAIGKGEYRIGKRFESGRGIAGEVWRTGQTVLVDDYRVWPQRAQDKGYALRRATVAVPLRYGGRLAGLLGLAHYDAARRFEGDDLAMLERLAELASLALDNAGLYDRMKQELMQRKRAEEELLQTTERLRRSLAGTVQAISAAVEIKDPYTSGHQKRTADLAKAIATEMGFTADRAEFVRIATTIHDIGKISVPSEILSKPTKLREIEFGLIKVHPQAGYDILKDIEFPWPVAEVILQHHERMDGSGYPEGLKGDAILLEARIVSVADVVEAIASHRPYRPALGVDAALEEIEKNRDVLYDPEAADACLRLFREKGYRLN